MTRRPGNSGNTGARAADEPLRVVMVAHSHLLGGMERHVLTLMNALGSAGHDVAYAGPADGWLGEQVIAAGLPHCHVPMHGMYDMLSAAKLTRFLKRFGADIAHGHSQRGARYAALSGRRAHATCVATAHSTNAFKWFDRNIDVIAVADAVRDFLLNKGLAKGLVHRVYSGVADMAISMSAPSERPADSPFTVGMVARLERVKGHDIALQALSLLRGQRPVHLRIVGSTDTAFAAEMRALARTLDIEHQVAFLGQRSDIAEQLAALDLLLAPSRREAIGLALMEACSASLPIAASRIGGIPEVVEDGVNGLLVPPEDPAALAEAIRKIASDDTLRLKMGRAARQRFEEHFTLAAMAGNTAAVYRHALQRQPAGATS